MSTVLTGPQRNACDSRGILRRLGIIGFDALEPIILAALATETPLLIIGKHGTAKSLLLCRLCEALGISWRHYNASLVNYDDLVGYPLPNAAGKLEFVQTPASIWDAEAVFIDEISRARPDMQNRLFPIVHERKVQGIPLDKLRFRWCAMNPPAIESDIAESYIGSEPLDPALADRFGFIVEAPDWGTLTNSDREAVITSEFSEVSEELKADLRGRIEEVRREIAITERVLKEPFTVYVREIIEHARKLHVVMSGRRSSMLFRNMIAVHAARTVMSPNADPADSSWIALTHSLPHRATGVKSDLSRLLVAHNTLWKTLWLDANDPRKILAMEHDTVRRAIRATCIESLARHEFSAYVADAFAELPSGGRHALAHFLFEGNHANRLIAAVAEQTSDLYVAVATKQDINTMVRSGSGDHQGWLEIVSTVAALDSGSTETTLITNLLASEHQKRQVQKKEDVQSILSSWRLVRALCDASVRKA